MRLLYVSKAMTTGAYRDKLRELAGLVELHAVMPERWGPRPVDPPSPAEPWLESVPAALHGHNHFHVYRDVSAWLRQARPDLVHIDEEPYSAVTAQLARHCARQGVPFLFFAWQNLHKRIPQPFARLRTFVFARAGGGIAGTAQAAAVLRAWGYHGPLEVIPQMGVDTCRFRADPVARAEWRRRLRIGAADFAIGFGGRLVPEKGVQQLLQALTALPDAALVIAGDGPLRRVLQARARQAGVLERLHLLGDVPAHDMPGLLNACDVVALPSTRTAGWMEQFGRILVEAMAVGVPVIGSTLGEIPAVIGDAGLVVREGDSGALVRALMALADSPAARQQLSARGRTRALACFTNRRIAQETVSFYERMLGAAAA